MTNLPKQWHTAADTYKRHGFKGIRQLIRAKINRKPIIDISDEYINWLCLVNAGMLHRGNLYCFDYALKHLPTSDPIIEIGSFCGLSINVMTYYKAKYNVENRLITCDRWNFEGAITGTMVGQSSVSHAEYRAYAKDTFLRNVKMFSEKDLPYTIEMFSDEFFQAWAKSQHVSDVFERPIQLGGNISFCYIDGNHSYEYVKRDFEHCHQFLVPQGFILFDDSADGSRWHEINQMVNEVAQSQQYELIIKNPNYFFRKK